MFRAVLLLSVFFGLFACGQKGALYLAEKKPKQPTEEGIFIKQPATTVLPDVVQMNHVKVVGKLAQINQNNVPSWQAALTTAHNNTNLVRYVIFDDNLLIPAKPRTMLIGTVQNPHLATDTHAEQRVIPSGNYLRFRATETGVQYIPKLIAAARTYVAENAGIRHRNAPDFLIDNQQAIDLYIAVERIK